MNSLRTGAQTLQRSAPPVPLLLLACLPLLFLLSAVPVAAQDVPFELPVDCDPALEKLVQWPSQVLGDSREEAIESVGLGPPRRVSVEILESRHDQSQGFRPMLRFELSWNSIQVVYFQSSTGGRELFQELTLRPSDSPLDFAIPFDTPRAKVLELLGPPEEASEQVLAYTCLNSIGGDRLTFSFRKDQLVEIHWWIFID